MRAKLMISISLTCCSMFLLQQLSAQTLKVHTGGMYMKSNTFLHLHETDLETDGDFTGSDNAILKLSTTANKLFLSGSNQPELWHLELNGDCILETNIAVKGNFEFRSGIMDIGPHNLNLGGVLLNEGELSYITSSAFGEIVKRASLTANQKMEPGNMGLGLVSSGDYDYVEIRRGHVPQSNGTSEGIDRYYSFDQPVDLKLVNMKYRTAELRGENPDAMSVWTQKGTVWEENTTISNLVNEISAEGFQKSDLLSVFPASEGALVTFPTGFSPNGDGLNDFFVIGGIENYPNSRFVVVNQWGDVLFDESPYQNKWDGKSAKGALLKGDKQLVNGTYFYIFFKDADRPKTAIRGFIEIETN